jgi:thiol-disulfide isomerase/thioredoxin
MSRLRAAAALALVAFSLVGCTGRTAPPAGLFQTFAPADRKDAPLLSGDLLDGSGAYDAAPQEGNVVVVNFWASWCGPCVGEAPELDAVYDAHKGDGVVFVGINVYDQLDSARAFARQHTTFPSVFDPSSRVALGFAVQPNAIPSTIVLDRQGRIAAIARSEVAQAELEPVVEALLAEAA